MQITLRVNTRDQQATARSASLMERLGGIVAAPLSPTAEAASVPLRDAGRASDGIVGLRIDGSMLRQPFSPQAEVMAGEVLASQLVATPTRSVVEGALSPS